MQKEEQKEDLKDQPRIADCKQGLVSSSPCQLHFNYEPAEINQGGNSGRLSYESYPEIECCQNPYLVNYRIECYTQPKTKSIQNVVQTGRIFITNKENPRDRKDASRTVVDAIPQKKKKGNCEILISK